MMTFKEFLLEQEVQTDPEDLSAEELSKRANLMRKRAQLKAQGREEQADKHMLRDLQLQLRSATDPRQKADLGRRIKELTTMSPEEQQQQQAQ